MTRAARMSRQTVNHNATIPVVENLPNAMYLRQQIATGAADDGTPIDVSTTGPHLIIQLGEWPNGRQFVINVADMAKAVLEQLTQPSTVAHGDEGTDGE